MNTTRRDWLLSRAALPALALAACGRKRSPRYQGYALIANHDGGAVAVIDLSRFARLDPIPVPAAPSWILAASLQGRAFALGADSPTMAVLDLDKLEVAHTVRLPGLPQAALMGPGARFLWLLIREPDALVQFDVAAGRVTHTVRLPGAACAFDVAGGMIAIAMADSRRVGLYDIARRSLSVSPALAASPSLVRFRGDGRVILVGNTAARSISVLDAHDLRLMVDLPLPLAPRHFCLKQDGGQLFVTGDGMDAVVIVNPYATEIDQTILAGNAPGGMAVTSAGPQYLFVANPHSGDVTVINIDDRRVLVQIACGQDPGTVLLTPDNEYALVLNERSGDVAVIRLLNIRRANLISRRSRTATLFTLIPIGAGPVSGAICPRVA